MRRRLIPDFVTLQAFECAARHQNFSRAAEELNLTQSAVSRQIAELEQQTGLRLFERVRQRVILSEAGHRLLPEVKGLLQQSERMMIGAVASGRMRGALKVATLPTFGAKWLVPRLGHFLASHPDIAVTIESRTRPFSFAEESFDIAIHFGQPAWAGGICQFLCHESVIPVASPALAQQAGIGGPGDIGAAPLLHLTTRPKLWAEWFQLADCPIDNAYLGLRLDQFSMIVAAAIAGLGIALLPTYLIEEEIRAGTLVAVSSLALSTDNGYYVVRPEARQSHPAAKQFEDWLLAEVQPIP